MKLLLYNDLRARYIFIVEKKCTTAIYPCILIIAHVCVFFTSKASVAKMQIKITGTSSLFCFKGLNFTFPNFIIYKCCVFI